MKTSLGQSLLALVLAATGANGLNAQQWRGQSIYQVLTDRFARTDGSTSASCDLRSYCGGTWRGLINKLDYIQGMGFTAVWISPIVENIAGPTPYGYPYHGYWAQNIWTLNSNFGTAADLSALSAALHSRGMYLMVDIVTNHMGYNGCRTCVNYSIYNTEFQDSNNFHLPPCAIDFNSNNETQLDICWSGDNVVSLPDLKTESDYVRSVFSKWITQLVTTYNIDGLRIDSARSVEKTFFKGFGQAAGVYQVGEVFDGNPTNIAAWNGYIDGLLNYPAFYWIRRAFASDSATVNELITQTTAFRNQVDTTVFGTFIENHDNARFPTVTTDTGRIQNAIAYTILSDGIPIIYEGQEQGFSGAADPNNREAVWPSGYNTQTAYYQLIAKVNQIRNHVVYASGSGYLSYQATPIKINDYALALRKGVAGAQVVGVFSNMGTTGTPYTVTLNGVDTGFTSGQQVVEVLGCGQLTADGSGNVKVQINAGPSVLYPRAGLVGSGICGL